MNYIAHTKKNAKNKFSVQTIKTHSLNTKKLAHNFALGPYRDIAGTAALLHDIGKKKSRCIEYLCSCTPRGVHELNQTKKGLQQS